MNWSQLLSFQRLGKDQPKPLQPGRSPFQQDFDRIIFSSAFRRLQDKTQVFPLAEHDYVRTRLTHSLEAASIGRSLGAGAGVFICRHGDLAPLQPSDVGAICAAASLGHDIGNPPFGHSGEEAIRHWFTHSAVAATLQQTMTEHECADFRRYEGNAQGFRVLARLQMPDNYGGMQLTCATLAAAAKYPYPGSANHKKFNFFQADRELFRLVAEATGMRPRAGEDFSWYRHPLAFLVEAADDITYRIIDFEDGHALKIIPYPEIERLFLAIIDDGDTRNKVQQLHDPERKVEMLRAKALGTLIDQIIKAFERYHDAILAGELEQPLIHLIPAAPVLAEILQRSIEEVYTFRRAVEIEAAGYELTFGLLDTFVPALEEAAFGRASDRSRKLLQLLPKRYCPVDDPAWKGSSYLRLLMLLDYLAGMTDSYAVSLFKKIKGISLPGMMM